MPMQDYHFELGGVEFGIGRNVSVDSDGFDTGSADWRVQDGEEGMGDGTTFGRDYLGSPEWAFTMHTNRETDVEALESLEQLATVWRNEELRQKPNAVVPLRYTIGDRTRLVYGRPRRWAAPPSNLILGGMVPIAATFKCADHLTYDELEQSAQVNLGQSSAGGFVFPLVFPVAMTGGQDRVGVARVDGSAGTWAKVRFQGPAINPRLQIAGQFECQWIGTLREGEWVELDSRPWARTVLRHDGASVPTLSRRTRLAQMKLSPGAHELQFSAGGCTSSTVCKVSWRGANNSL